MDYSDKLERAEDEIYRLGEAAEYLDGVRGAEDIVQWMKDRMIVLGFEKEQYHRLVEEEDRVEDEVLEREYYAALI